MRSTPTLILLGIASVLLGCTARESCVGDCEGDTEFVGCSLSSPPGDDGGAAETGGLSCGDDLPGLADARVFRVADLEQPPAGIDPNGYLLVLSSQTGICEEPVGGFECGDAYGYRLYIGLPPDFDVAPFGEAPGYEFGATAGPLHEADIPAWIQVGQTTDCCSLTTPPVSANISIHAFDPETLELSGSICSYVYTPEVGHGLSGMFTTLPAC